MYHLCTTVGTPYLQTSILLDTYGWNLPPDYRNLSQFWFSRASGAFHLKLFLKETIPLVSVNLPPNKKQTHPQATRSRWFITYIVPTSGSVSIQVPNRGIPYVYPEVHCFIIITPTNGF